MGSLGLNGSLTCLVTRFVTFCPALPLPFVSSQSRTPSPTLPRSGNPGYITGAPLLALQKGVPRHVSFLASGFTWHSYHLVRQHPLYFHGFALNWECCIFLRGQWGRQGFQGLGSRSRFYCIYQAMAMNHPSCILPHLESMLWHYWKQIMNL